MASSVGSGPDPRLGRHRYAKDGRPSSSAMRRLRPRQRLSRCLSDLLDEPVIDHINSHGAPVGTGTPCRGPCGTDKECAAACRRRRRREFVAPQDRMRAVLTGLLVMALQPRAPSRLMSGWLPTVRCEPWKSVRRQAGCELNHFAPLARRLNIPILPRHHGTD
jgi:hypothetical protein